MKLILEIIVPMARRSVGRRTKTIGPEGAQIGRSNECDWVINDRYVARMHARIVASVALITSKEPAICRWRCPVR